LTGLLLLLLALTALSQPAPVDALLSPAQVVKLAADDLAGLPADVQPHIRYISLAMLPATKRSSWAAVLSGHVNGLSREVDLVQLASVGGGFLLRVNLLDYGIDPRVWDKLPDPYFTARIRTTLKTLWPGGVWTDGQSYAAGSFVWVREEVTVATAPWLSETPAGKTAVTYLAAQTGSPVPVVHGPWFLWQTATDEGRGGLGYSGFLGVKNQKDFENLVRFDAKQSAKLEHLRGIVWSDITQQPRRFKLGKTTVGGGGYYETFDSALAVDAKNPIRVLEDAGNGFEFDVTEKIAAGLNGWPKNYLGNSKGERADKAPDNIVQGDHTGTRSKELLNNISCWGCHTEGKAFDYIRPIDPVPIRKLTSYDYETFLTLKRQYKRDATLQTQMAIDRASFAGAVKEATGMTIQEFGQSYRAYYNAHDDLRAGVAQVSRDWGLTGAQVTRAMRDYGEDRLDPVLSIVLSGGTIPRSAYEELQPVLAQVFAGVKR
jgi:hypothetical protein